MRLNGRATCQRRWRALSHAVLRRLLGLSSHSGGRTCNLLVWSVGVILLGLSLPEGLAEPVELQVMTFNLKYASESGENKWSERREVLKNAIANEDPDLIGTQEGLYGQLKDIESDLPQYRWIGLGRAGGSKEEFMAVFYRHDRFEPLAFDHFWLSDTPDVIGSRTWGNSNRRMVTWVLFRDKKSGAEFYHWNTHFDHEVQAARENSADLLLARIGAREPVRPVVVTGDFNAVQANAVHAKLVSAASGPARLSDAWEIAEARDGEGVSTFNGWKGPDDRDRRIDWILVSPEFACTHARVVTYQEKGQFPSDHFPVVCDFVLTSP